MLAPTILSLALLAAPAPDLLTTAERSAFERTGRYAEVERLCRALPAAFPGRARCFTFGTTPEGRPLLALAASADGALEPRAARARGREVVLFQGGIHAGEIDGKDAGFIALRELLAAGRRGPLARVTVLFVPVLNVDGHERFGPNQRPNQRGPAETGWRTTAQNLNLNRDYAKADSPELRAVLALLETWDPIVYADLHVTDGAQFEHDLSVTVAPRFSGAPPLRAAGTALSAALLERLADGGHLPLDFYPAFVDDEDPASGFAQGEPRPFFAHGYWAWRNRLGVLLETHSWKPYGARVRGTVDFLRALVELAARDAVRWRQAAAAADRLPLSGATLPLAFARGEGRSAIEFRGYAYEKVFSVALGKHVLRYDEDRPLVWAVPLFGPPAPSVTVTLPRGGWVVPAAHASWAGERLRAHGIRFERLAAARPRVAVERFKARSVRFGPQSYEGRQRLELAGAWALAEQGLGVGALFVPVAQPRARLAAHLLEPLAPDSLAAWGFFNAAFERKEYIEEYALAPFADDLFARDPAVAAEVAALEASKAGREGPATERHLEKGARVELFARRHPSWDEAYEVYPVVRVDARP